MSHAPKSALQFLQPPVDFLAERHAVEHVEQRLAEPFANPIGLWAPHFRLGVVNVFHRQAQLILVAVWRPTVLSPPISQHPTEWNAVLLEEGHHPSIEQIRRRQRRLAIIEFGHAYLAVGVDEGLLIDPAHAFECLHMEGILGAAVTPTLTLDFAMGFLARFDPL